MSFINSDLSQYPLKIIFRKRMFLINFFVPFVVVLPLLLNVNQKFFPVMPGPKQLLTSQVADAGGAGGGDGVGDGEPYKKEIG